VTYSMAGVWLKDPFIGFREQYGIMDSGFLDPNHNVDPRIF